MQHCRLNHVGREEQPTPHEASDIPAQVLAIVNIQLADCRRSSSHAFRGSSMKNHAACDGLSECLSVFLQFFANFWALLPWFCPILPTFWPFWGPFPNFVPIWAILPEHFGRSLSLGPQRGT